MAVQLISYDLAGPEADYTDLFDAIKAYGSWWHCLESVWLVSTTWGTAAVRDALQRQLGANDKLLVVQLSGMWATAGLTDSTCNEWLKNNM